MFWFGLLLGAIFLHTLHALIVITEQGALNGTYSTARNGRMFNAFYGIPYAKPPVGSLRFKSPVEPEPWSGVLDASIKPSICIQGTKSGDEINGSEDCLNINVYTPLNARRGDDYSVIVYIYGGAYKGGSNLQEGPNYIMNRDVILTMPNYREGGLGFLSTGDSVIPGNFGLKDQTMALKWVQKNIHHFGGNPNRVTLQGHSSGAVNVHFHTLSPLSKGLFHRVIIQSGTAVGTISYFGRDVTRSVTKEFAIRAGCPSIETSKDMYDCFMTLDASVFPAIQNQMFIWNSDPDATFRPTIEDKSVPDAFITEIPNTIHYHSPDIPWIIGMTTAEGAFKVATYLSNDGELVNEIDEHFKLLFPITMQYLWNTKWKNLDYTSQIIRTHYFGNRSVGFDTKYQMVDMYTHGLFGISTIDAIYQYPGPKYVYWYDYQSNYSTQSTYGYTDEYLGVSHGSEIYIFFCRNTSDPVLTEQDVMFGDELIKRWVNFVDTGNPNIPAKINKTIMGIWEPMTSKRIEYLHIDMNGTMGTDLYKGVYEFWKSLPIGNKYYKN